VEVSEGSRENVPTGWLARWSWKVSVELGP